MISARRNVLKIGCAAVLLFCVNYLFILLVVHSSSSQQHAALTVGQALYLPANIIIYNRVPKTGSTTFTNAIAYDMCKENGFHAIHLNITKNRQQMLPQDQYHFIKNVTEWTAAQPAFYHGHVAFVDFTKFGFTNPIYINLLREPLDRLLSHYYFLRYGDNYRVGLKRSRAGNNETFDDCVERKGRDCDTKHMWIQIPYFCGHHDFCSEVGSNLAFDEAKRNLLNHYLLVGTVNKMREFIALLDVMLPHFFRGALQHFDGLDETRSHLRHTTKKIPPSDQTVSIIKRSEVYKMEKEFYDFAKERFAAVLLQATNGTGDISNLIKVRQYHYEKIKPSI